MSAAASAVTMPVTLYIPYVRVQHTKEYMKTAFEFAGEITRIDFVEIRNFQTKEVNPQYKHAFIHLSHICQSEQADALFQWIHDYEHVVMNFPDENGNIAEFWKVYIAEQPVPETELNIHQLANNFRIVDDKVLDLEEENFRQSVLIEQLEERIQYMEERMQTMEKHFQTLENRYISFMSMGSVSFV